jgi:hypothetical protein
MGKVHAPRFLTKNRSWFMGRFKTFLPSMGKSMLSHSLVHGLINVLCQLPPETSLPFRLLKTRSPERLLLPCALERGKTFSRENTQHALKLIVARALKDVLSDDYGFEFPFSRLTVDLTSKNPRPSFGLVQAIPRSFHVFCIRAHSDPAPILFKVTSCNFNFWLSKTAPWLASVPLFMAGMGFYCLASVSLRTRSRGIKDI